LGARHVEVTTVEHVENSTKLVGRDTTPIDTLATSSRVKPFELLSTSLPLTPLQIGVGLKIILIFSTPHASKAFTIPIITFDETPD
jgi:hypothetical protein